MVQHLFSFFPAVARRRGLYVVLPLAVAAVVSACSSSDLSISAPSAAKCSVDVASTLTSVPASGATGTLRVTTTRDCTWEVASPAGWIEVTGSRSGQGSAEVGYRVAPNGEPARRSATVSVNDVQVSVSQDPAPCRFTVSPTGHDVPAGGDRVSVRVDTHAACGWTVRSEVDWVRVAGSEARTGSGSVTLEVSANDGPARSGSATIAGQRIRVEQAAVPVAPPIPGPTPAPVPPQAPGPAPTPGPAPSPGPAPTPTPSPSPAPTPSPSPSPTPAPDPPPAPAPTPCTFAVSPRSATVPGGEGTFQVTVATQSSCTWTVRSEEGWLTLVSSPSVAGSGTARFDVKRHKGKSARVGTIVAAGQTVTVTQSPGRDDISSDAEP